jgi:hypothetical protein
MQLSSVSCKAKIKRWMWQGLDFLPDLRLHVVDVWRKYNLHLHSEGTHSLYMSLQVVTNLWLWRGGIRERSVPCLWWESR